MTELLLAVLADVLGAAVVALVMTVLRRKLAAAGG
jgi:hypothetical protein